MPKKGTVCEGTERWAVVVSVFRASQNSSASFYIIHHQNLLQDAETQQTNSHISLNK